MNEWGKIELLRRYECWTDKTSKLYKRGVKKSPSELVSCHELLSTCALDFSNPCKYTNQKKMEDRSNTSLRAKSTLSMLNFSLRLPIVWLVCMYALILFCLSQKKNYVLLLKISLCPEKPFFHILFSEIPLNLSPQLGCECWIWD